MNAVQLKKLAEKLVKKLNALGFTKDGKPMVVDQAYELVASMKGFRNQHALRASLGVNPAEFVGIPVDIDEEFAKALLVQHYLEEDDFNHAYEAWGFIVEEAKKRGFMLAEPEEHSAADVSQAHTDWASIVRKQGWNDEAQLIHTMGFIADRGLMLDFVAYAQKAADEENATDAGVSDSELTIPAAGKGHLLEELGYTVKKSDFNGYFWENQEEASEDFSNPAQAWAAAWEHAVTTAILMTGISRELFNLKDLTSQAVFLRKNSFKIHQAHLAILKNCGFSFKEDSDQPGHFVWTFRDEGCDISFDSMEGIVQDAWDTALKRADLPQSIVDATPLDAQSILVEAALTGKTYGTDMARAVDELERKWGYQHEYYTREDWEDDVALGHTRLGYWEWVQHNSESWESENDDHYHCSACGCRAGDDGEGEGGLCGNCADAAENKRSEALERKVVDQAFEDYDFGENFSVGADSGWETSSGTGIWSRSVFLEDKRHPGADTIKKTFTVEVVNGKAANISVR